MLNATQGFTYNKFEKPNDWPKIDKTFDYKIENGKLLSGNEHIYLSGPVTYIKVGNPTIVDGVASGFSTVDYLKTESFPSSYSSFEINIGFSYSSSLTSRNYLMRSNDDHFRIFLDFNSTRIYWLTNLIDGTTPNFFDISNLSLSQDIKYIVNASYINGVQTLTLKDSSGNIIRSKNQTIEIESISSKTLSLVQANDTTCSIDLNSTYIKINDQLWFYGKNYTTKNMVPVPAGLEYNNTTAPSNGWVYTNSDLVKGPVDYTVVGNPTIVDGVVSGFSSTNYLRVASNFPLYYNTSFEVSSKIKLNKVGNISYGCYGTSNFLPFYYSWGGIDFRLRASSSAQWTSVRFTSSDGISISAGIDYYFKMIYDGRGTITASISIDNQNWVTKTLSIDDTVFPNNDGTFLLGNVANTGTNIDTIDLNYTYIKVNGQPWFGNVSRFQEFIPAPEEAQIGKDDTHNLVVETPIIKGQVDYEVVGSPTIVNGVASGFWGNGTSSDNPDFLKITPIPATIKSYFRTSFEMQTKIKVPNTSKTSIIFYWPNRGGSCGFSITNSNILKFTTYVMGQYDYNISSINAVQANDIIWLKGTINNNLAEFLISNDGTNWVSQGTLDITDMPSDISADNYARLGVNGATYPGYYFNGSIDLNETYIKVNNQYWFKPKTELLSPKLVGPVDYTLSGNATVTNGILSNIVTSPSSSCVTPSLPEEYSTLEFMFNVGYSQQFNTSSYIPVASFNSVNSYLRINGNSSTGHRLYYTSSDSDYIMEISTNEFDIISAANQAGGYYIKLLVQKNDDVYIYTLGCSTDKQNWITKTANSSVQICKGLVSLLRSASGASAGRPQMNLNNTYIKVNGSLWFGKEDWTPSTHTDNAIYLLGSHNTDYSTYNTQGINPTIETESDESGTYNVWIDNQEIYKEQSNPLDINWSNLALTTGYDITTPSTLKAHVIKVEPNNGNITRFSADTNYKVENGLLTWASPKLYLEGPTQYTVVGSPTMVDGVASGFSANDYLQTSSVFSNTDTVELFVRVKNPSQFASRGICGASTYNGNFGLVQYASSAFSAILAVKDADNTTKYIVLTGTGTTYISEEYDIYAKYDISNRVIELKYWNISGTLLFEGSKSFEATDTVIAPTAYYLGQNQYGAFGGSINLNETYIKVNNDLWFGKIYTSETDVPVPANFTYGNTTTSSNGTVNLTTQEFSADTLANYGKDS